MVTTQEYVGQIVENNKQIQSLCLREYSYPVPSAGTKPAVGDKLYSVSRSEFLEGKTIDNIIASRKTNRHLGIESRVATTEGLRHFPMLDFNLAKSGESLALLKRVIKKSISPYSGPGGIIETDNSYHLVGEKLLTPDEYIDFMSWSLLATDKYRHHEHRNIVDVHYVGYCLLKRSSCLRITSYPNSSHPPFLIASF